MKIAQLREKVGQVVGTSDWYVIDQDRIDRFADATEDHQFIHVDPERAKDSPFGQTIAHGFLTLSMLAPFLATGFPEIEEKAMGVNYGFDRVRFLAPVKSGQRVRGHWKLLALDEKKPGLWQQTAEVTVEIEGEDKPALVAEWIIQILT